MAAPARELVVHMTAVELRDLIREAVRAEVEQLRGELSSGLTTDQAAEVAGVEAKTPRRRIRCRDRYIGLKLAAGRCRSCGWEPLAGGAGVLNAHHVIPTAAGGGEEDNVVVLCPNCHAIAHALTSIDHLLDLLRRMREDPVRFRVDEQELLRRLRLARTGDVL